MFDFAITTNNGLSATIERYPAGDVLPGENVHFRSVNLTGYSGEDQYRDILRTWDFDDAGATYSISGGGKHNDANRAKHLVVTKAWQTQGNKTVTKSLRYFGQDVAGTVTESVTVADPDAVAWDNDLYVSFAGDFSGAPPVGGAVQHISSLAALLAISMANTDKTRITFRRGETFTWGSSSWNVRGRVYVTSNTGFGSGAPAKIEAGAAANPASASSAVDVFRVTDSTNLRLAIYEVDFDGKYNPVTGNAPAGLLRGVFVFDNATTDYYVSAYRCTATGMYDFLLSSGSQFGTTLHLLASDCVVTDWHDYAIASFQTELIAGVEGCRIEQDPLTVLGTSGAVDGKPNAWPQAADHANRFSAPRWFGINNTRSGPVGGWSGLSSETAMQPSWRIMIGTHTEDDPIPVQGNVADCVSNGAQFCVIGVSSAGTLNPSPSYMRSVDAIVEGNNHTVTRQGFGTFLQLGTGGARVLNNILYLSNLISYRFPSNAFINTQNLGSGYNVASDTRTKPTYVGYNTVMSDRTADSLGDGSGNFVFFDTAGWDADVAEWAAPITERNVVSVDGHTNVLEFTDYGDLDRTNDFRTVTGSVANGAASSGFIPTNDYADSLRTNPSNYGAHHAVSVSAGSVSAPVNSVVPTIGVTAMGNFHVASLGTWSNLPNEYLYEIEWNDDGAPITNGYTSQLDPLLVEGGLTLDLTVSNLGGTRQTATSAAITVEEIVSNDFTTDSTTESVSITPSDGSKWTNENINGASSTRGYTTHESQQVYSFFVDGADGETAPPEKASLVDDFTFQSGGYTAPAAMTYGDTLVVEFEIKVDGNGWTVFDFEQKEMTTSASGTLTNQGVRIALDDSGSWVVIRSELSSNYSTWTQIVGTTAFPFNEWVTVRVVANINDDANGRVRIWQNDELVLDNNGSVMFNAADILASDGITLTGTPQVDVLEFGLSALYDSITGSRTMYARNFDSKIIRA